MHFQRLLSLWAVAAASAVVVLGSSGCKQRGPAADDFEVPVAENAVSMPDALKEDAVFVTVTRGGHVYLGRDGITKEMLSSRVRDLLVNKLDKTVYLRGDEQVKVGVVEEVLDSLRAAGVDEAGLLTRQKNISLSTGDTSRVEAASQRAAGLDVLLPSGPDIGRLVPASDAALRDRMVIVRVSRGSGGVSAYQINGANVGKADLLPKFTEIFQNRMERVLMITADGEVNFGTLAETVDAAKAAGVDHIAFLTPAQAAGH